MFRRAEFIPRKSRGAVAGPRISVWQALLPQVFDFPEMTLHSTSHSPGSAGATSDQPRPFRSIPAASDRDRKSDRASPRGATRPILDNGWAGCYDASSVLGKIMRRRLEAFIPIVLLAILVQLMAPIAAFRVVANAVSDPLYMATICSGMASSQDASQTTPAKTQHDGANCCAFCGGGLGCRCFSRSLSFLDLDIYVSILRLLRQESLH